jgi:tripartite-type tricarboxylate transporter receptor subunit TctC
LLALRGALNMAHPKRQPRRAGLDRKPAPETTTMTHRPLFPTRRVVLLAAAASVAAPAVRAQSAADFPSKPIRIILPFTPGGTTDALARGIGQKLTEYWGQPVVIDNRPGAAGWLGISQMAKMPADGYTIGLTISNIIYAHALYTKLPFDIQKDFEPVSMISRSAVALAVAASFPANTLEEFVALVKKNPGKYSYASFGQGTSANIFGESLNLAAKLDLVHVPYKGAAPMVTDLLGGQVSSVILDTASLRPLAQSGKAKVLAMTGAQRATVFPTVPTFAELGYPGFEPVGFFMVLAPAGTPKELVRKLSEGIARAVRTDEMRTRIADFGQELVGGTPEQLAQGIRVDGEIFAKAIRTANIKVEQNQ